MLHHYTPSSHNEIHDVFVYSTDYWAPVMVKCFDAVTGTWLNVNSGITVGDLMTSYHIKRGKVNDKQDDASQK